MFFIAYVGTSSFSAASTVVATASDQDSLLMTIIFPGLTVNTLTPGEKIEMVPFLYSEYRSDHIGGVLD